MKIRMAMAALAITMLMAAAARADWTLQWKIEGMPVRQGKEVKTMTMKIKGDKVRMDMGEEASVIYKAGDANVTLLMHAPKMYMQGPVQGSDQQKDAPKITATGNKEKIGDYDTEEYIVESAGGTTHMWVCKDFPKYKEIFKPMAAMLSAQRSGAKLDADAIPGMPIRVKPEAGAAPAQRGPGAGSPLSRATMTLDSCKEEGVDDSVFKAPADYKDMMEMMRGMQHGE